MPPLIIALLALTAAITLCCQQTLGGGHHSSDNDQQQVDAAVAAAVGSAKSEDDPVLGKRSARITRLTRYPQFFAESVSSVPVGLAYQRNRQRQTPRVSTEEEQASLITGTYGLSGPPLKSVGSSAYEAAVVSNNPYQDNNPAATPLFYEDNNVGSSGYASSPPAYSSTEAPYQPTSSASPYAQNQCDKCKTSCNLVSKASCPYGDGWFQYRDSCYYFEKLRQLPWLQARGFCSLLTDTSGLHRGHLVIVNDAKEEQFLGKVAQRLIEYGYPDRYWTDGVLDGFDVNLGTAAAAAAAAAAASALGENITVVVNPADWEWFTLYSIGDRSYYRPNITVVEDALDAFCIRANVNSPNNMAPMQNGTAAIMPVTLFYQNEPCLDIQTPLCEIQLDGNTAR